MSNMPQLINYYPKYEYLDSILSKTNNNKLNVYIDLKGCMQPLYQEWAIRYIVEQSASTKMVDCSMFFAVLNFISFHKKYAKKRGVDIKLIFFFENGTSQYHKDIYKDYKKNRELCDVFNLPEMYKENFDKIRAKNYNSINNVCNKIPGVMCIKLDYIEADFIPYYLMNYIMKDDIGNDTTNVIYSMDKDLFQCLKRDNDFLFYRHHLSHKMLDKTTAWQHYLFKGIKDEEKLNNNKEIFKVIDLDYFPLVLSICGDSSDSVPKGISKIGEITFFKKYYDEIVNVFGTPDEMYNNILKNKTLFRNDEIKNTTDPYLIKLVENEKTIIQNMKLTSFRLLSEYIHDPSTTSILDKKNYIKSTVDNVNKISSGKVLTEALKNFGLSNYIEEQTVYDMF